jgi:anti-sigma B factor antagonist
MPLLELRVDTDGDVVRLALQGELDISSASRVEREIALLEDTAPRVLVLDLRGLDFMDSTGLRIVVSANARAEASGRRFVVVRGPEPVHRIFRITRLEERLDMVDDAGELETA